MDMHGKAAIVTGGGRDIGAACARRLGAAGAKVAINYHSSAEGAQAVAREIVAAGGDAFAMQGDMTRASEAQALADAAAERFGGLDALIHVTGGLVARRKLPEITLDYWDEVLALNLTSLMLVAQAARPHMRAGGSIVAMASQAGRDGGGPGALAYAASKGAVMSLTRGLAKELGPEIRVNALCPGMIDTDFHNVFTKPEVRTAVAANTPLKREGTSQEVAELAVFLASGAASFVTGACYDINGGMLFS